MEGRLVPSIRTFFTGIALLTTIVRSNIRPFVCESNDEHCSIRKWKVSGALSRTAHSFVFDSRQWSCHRREYRPLAFLQFMTSGTTQLRVPNAAVRLADLAFAKVAIVSHFDQEATAGLISLLATWNSTSESEVPTWPIGSIVYSLISVYYLGFSMINFRRSNGVHPDTINPADSATTAVPSKSDCVLLLDTFFRIVLCHGASITSRRYPTPEVIICDQDSSGGRYYRTKCNRSSGRIDASSKHQKGLPIKKFHDAPDHFYRRHEAKAFV
jgi:hypothetical protein